MTRLPFVLVVLTVSPLASAQTEPPQDTSEEAAMAQLGRWESPWAPAWDLDACCRTGGVSLDLSAGQVRYRALGGEERSGVEAYFLAQLRFPFGVFLGGLTRPKVAIPLVSPATSWNQKAQSPGLWTQAPRAGLSSGRQAEGGLTRIRTRGDRTTQSDADVGEDSVAEGAGHPVVAGKAADDGGQRKRPVPAAQAWPRPLPTSFATELLVRAAQESGWDQAVGRLDSIARRSRSSGLLPELRLRGVGGLDQIYSFDAAGYLPVDGTQRNATDTLLEVRLTFHLERLLLGDEEPSVERLRAQLLRERNGLMGDVLELLADWDEARLELSRPDLHDDELAGHRRHLRRLGLILDVMTGGWFQKAVAEAIGERISSVPSGGVGSRLPGR